MATNLRWNEIVPEVLRKDNYENWRDCLKNYLLGQDLWDAITDPQPEKDEPEFKIWRKKNAMALHAIQISCGTDILSQIRKLTSAKDAWDFLAELQEPKSQGEVSDDGPVTSSIPGPQLDYSLRPLAKAVWNGDRVALKRFLDRHPEAIKKIFDGGKTILHRAVHSGHVDIVRDLLQLMSDADLEIRTTEDGSTAFFDAALTGMTQMAISMYEKNSNLVSIANVVGYLPVVVACGQGHNETARYLYSVTPVENLIDPEKERNGATLLSYCIVGKMFDIALDLIRKCRRLALAIDRDGKSPVFILSRMPFAFPSGTRLVFWQRWIYSCTRVPPTTTSNYVRINIQNPYQGQADRRSDIVRQVSRLLHGLLSDLAKLLGINQIYRQKVIHVQALELLRHICEEIQALDGFEVQQRKLLNKALLQAVKHGILEIVKEITNANTDFLFVCDTNERSLFQGAIVYRQEKIFSLVYGLGARFGLIISDVDRSKNNMLHSAGMLAPSTRLDGISGAALQMQRELQWFKEVERVVPPMATEMLNSDGQTPRELFTETHREMVKEGQRWMKETATSCTVVAALIVTIMFAAAFTLPGGTKGDSSYQDSGYPIFLGKNLFNLFIVCDVISFLSSSTSILVFLGILTSRYGEEYFLKSLPTKMIIGLMFLFISIATMTVAFCAAVFLMQHGQSSRVFTSVFLLASIPITLFVILQFPLLSEMFISTHGSPIFNREQKQWY